jgi:cation transport regulator
MPYASNDDLPARVRNHLPEHAQDIFREVFNNAWRTYGMREPHPREEIAHRIALGRTQEAIPQGRGGLGAASPQLGRRRSGS